MSDNVEETPRLVDETPISPIRPDRERKNSLENHLAHRPERAELVDSARIPDPQPSSTAAPGLLAHQKELQKHMLEDKLNDKISHRPAPEELIKDGVLLNDPRAEKK
ncbi:hypothetical protein AK830_g11881 [Neonectria ditissima]|uniref:RPEL repeat protein n=1 Tax=Neonectria ditissima TaxID=78410 RepID=A0A0P7B090_9HYPO|nr:hypothetical protein AK830_g11881 [Neonectria ditissima]